MGIVSRRTIGASERKTSCAVYTAIPIREMYCQTVTIDALTPAPLRGAVVVIDVLRAFTTAACAFQRGCKEIVLVEDVDEAFALRDANPSWLLLGEVQGEPIPGFDFGNSPSALDDVDLNGRTIVQRTTTGTRGVVRAAEAEILLCGSFVCASATRNFLVRSGVSRVTFVVTGTVHGNDADEDVALAEFLTENLTSGPPEPGPYLTRVRNSSWSRVFLGGARPEVFPRADLEIATQVDRCHFALPVRKLSGAKRPMLTVTPN